MLKLGIFFKVNHYIINEISLDFSKLQNIYTYFNRFLLMLHMLVIYFCNIMHFCILHLYFTIVYTFVNYICEVVKCSSLGCLWQFNTNSHCHETRTKFLHRLLKIPAIFPIILWRKIFSLNSRWGIICIMPCHIVGLQCFTLGYPLPFQIVEKKVNIYLAFTVDSFCKKSNFA